MRKFLFAIITCCLAATTAFAQISINEIHLDEDKPQDEIPIYIDDYEQGRIFIRINGEPDNQGRVPVQIELENSYHSYQFLLFDRAWPKKQLRKEYKVFFDKRISYNNALPVENLGLDPSQDYCITDAKPYIFPDILVDEGQIYECRIPIHLAKPKPNLFSKRKKILKDIIPYTLHISIENKDEAYDKLKYECDSLLFAFNRALVLEEFCTHPKHRPSFDVQTKEYTDANHELRDQIRPTLYDNNIPKESKKYKRYKALMESLDQMDNALEQYKGETHECVKHPPVKSGGKKTEVDGGKKVDGSKKVEVDKGPKCSYCNLSLQEIYNRLDRLYQRLFTGQVQKSAAIINEANALYRCGTTHSNSKRANDNSYKAGINEFYNKIKNY